MHVRSIVILCGKKLSCVRLDFTPKLIFNIYTMCNTTNECLLQRAKTGYWLNDEEIVSAFGSFINLKKKKCIKSISMSTLNRYFKCRFFFFSFSIFRKLRFTCSKSSNSLHHCIIFQNCPMTVRHVSWFTKILMLTRICTSFS